MSVNYIFGLISTSRCVGDDIISEMKKKKNTVLVAPVVGGVLAWILSGDWVLGVSIFAALIVGDLVRNHYK